MSTDPSGFLTTNPPSTIVKLQGTSRGDMNGKFGVAVQFNSDRGRYTVQVMMADGTNQIMALKPENLVKASTLERFRFQVTALRRDPRVRQEVQRYYQMVQQSLPPFIKPEHAAGAVVVLLLGLMYWVGFTRVLMVASMILLVGLIIAPDLVSQQPNRWRRVLQNFPFRCRVHLEQTIPFLKGRLNEKVAAGIIIVMLLLSVRSLFPTRAKRAVPESTESAYSSSMRFPSSNVATVTRETLESFYKLGFDDATEGGGYGVSLASKLNEVLPRSPIVATDGGGVTAWEEDEFPPRDLSSTSDDGGPVIKPFSVHVSGSPSPPPRPGILSKIGFSQLMSVFYLFRMAMEFRDSDGNFSFALLQAGLQTMEWWRLALLGFVLYNLVKVFL